MISAPPTSSPRDDDDDAPRFDAAPEPFEYNPSSWSQRVRVSLVASAAFFIAVYMALYQWRPADPSAAWLVRSVWDPIFGAQSMRVLDSDVSHTMSRWFRVPDAALGALAYLGDIIFALAGSTRRWQYRPWLVVLFGLDVIPLGIVRAVLVFMQGAVVGAWCFLCLVTAVISLILVVLAYDEVWSCLIYLWRTWRRSNGWRTLWDTFWGRPTSTAHEVAQQMIRERS